MRTYETTDDILRLVAEFESATISRDEWKHREHIIVALYYIKTLGRPAADEKMRAGILNLLTTGFGVNLTVENPYHETITIFWMNTIDEFTAHNATTDLPILAAAVTNRFDKDYPLTFYTRETLFSDQARLTYTAPNI